MLVKAKEKGGTGKRGDGNLGQQLNGSISGELGFRLGLNKQYRKDKFCPAFSNFLGIGKDLLV